MADDRGTPVIRHRIDGQSNTLEHNEGSICGAWFSGCRRFVVKPNSGRTRRVAKQTHSPAVLDMSEFPSRSNQFNGDTQICQYRLHPWYLRRYPGFLAHTFICFCDIYLSIYLPTYLEYIYISIHPSTAIPDHSKKAHASNKWVSLTYHKYMIHQIPLWNHIQSVYIYM